jgi:energy-coupling factor transporter transmembrane protein EcfT
LLSCYLVISVFFTLGVSRPLWRALPLLPFLQYPWRFLVLIVFFVSWLGGSLFLEIKKFCSPVLIFLILSVIFFNARYFQPQKFYSPNRDYVSFESLAWEASRRSDEYLPPGFKIPQDFNEVPRGKIVFEQGEGNIEEVVIMSDSFSFKIRSAEPVKLTINAISFPGFKAWVDGQETDLEVRGDELIGINLSSGEHRVLVNLTNTPVRTVANWLSLIGFGVWAGGMIKYHYGKEPDRKGRT